MAYTPPPPGSTNVGEPTPEGMPKQDAHIKDMPPEVRRSFLLSMVFFPSLVGAGICAVLFLGFWLLRSPKKSDRYALELREGIQSGTRRTRWQTAREIAENITSPEVCNPMVLTALLDIVEKPELDEEVEVWSPSMMIRGESEGSSRLRWWAAYLAGHIAARLEDPRGLEALTVALAERNEKDPQAAAGMRFFAAAGLVALKDPGAVDGLATALEQDEDPVVRAACAKALGSVGARFYAQGRNDPVLDPIREALNKSYRDDSDTDVTWNAAIALARIGDESGRKTLDALILHKDPVIQRNAKQALKILELATKEGASQSRAAATR